MALLHSTSSQPAHSHGGLLFPLDMFRPKALAQVLGEYFVSKARNVLDAKMVLTRHPRTQLCLLRIDGSVVGDDEGTFWRENSDVVLLFSRILPRQAFLYYVTHRPERREGFIVAQQGQALMADEVTRDRLPAQATDADWPIGRLCEQLGSTVDEVRLGFPGAPRIEVSLLDPEGDDRELLTALVKGEGANGGADEAGGAMIDDGYDEEDGDDGIVDAVLDREEPVRASQPTQAPPSAAATASAQRQAPAAAPARPRVSVADDEKRRAAERNAEKQARAQAVAAIHADLAYVLDDLGVVVAPKATLEDTDILRAYAQREVHGDLPPGVPVALTRQLQGKRIDFVIPVQFLSEVFIGHAPLNRSTFEATARSQTINGQTTAAMEVLAPRLGSGTLFRRDGKNVFVSRTAAPFPESLIEAVFQGAAST